MKISSLRRIMNVENHSVQKYKIRTPFYRGEKRIKRTYFE